MKFLTTLVFIQLSVVAILPMGSLPILAVQSANVVNNVAKNELPPELANLKEGSSSRHKKGDIAVWHSLKTWFPEGFEHILSGYDHLAFVIALALVFRRKIDLVKVITFFTLAHALTLTLAGLNIIHLGAFGISLIEAGIAFSVAWVGAEDIFLIKKKDTKLASILLKWRSLLAFSFGLVHGMGFAEKFRDDTLDLDYAQYFSVLKFLVQILFFNLGVDLGQLLVAFSVFFIIKYFEKSVSEANAVKVRDKIVFYSALTISIFGLMKLFEALPKLF